MAEPIDAEINGNPYKVLCLPNIPNKVRDELGALVAQKYFAGDFHSVPLTHFKDFCIHQRKKSMFGDYVEEVFDTPEGKKLLVEAVNRNGVVYAVIRQRK